MNGLPGPVKELQIVMDPPAHRNGISSLPAVQEISAVHKLVVQAQEAGFTHPEIAGMVNLDPAYVSQICQWIHPELTQARHEARERLSRNLADISSRIQFHAGEALEKMVQHMRGPDINASRLAAKDIMDRAGYAPVKKVAQVSTQVPTEEFVNAVERMVAVDEIKEMREKFQFKLPAKTGTNG